MILCDRKHIELLITCSPILYLIYVEQLDVDGLQQSENVGGDRAMCSFIATIKLRSVSLDAVYIEKMLKCHRRETALSAHVYVHFTGTSTNHSNGRSYFQR